MIIRSYVCNKTKLKTDEREKNYINGNETRKKELENERMEEITR
jgi:hypothetical protein